MELFDQKYIHALWDISLTGLKGFFAQDVCDLQEFVNKNIRFSRKMGCSCFGSVENSDSDLTHPFNMVWYTYQPTVKNTRTFRFFYHDPLYEMKLAWANGDIVEYRAGDSDWLLSLNPCWDSDLQYRISPPDAFATNHEIAQWVGQGRGELLIDENDSWNKRVVTSYSYPLYDALKPASVVGVRRWGETKWHSPTRAYLNESSK